MPTLPFRATLLASLLAGLCPAASLAHTTTRLLRTETAYTDDFVQIALLGQTGVGGIADRVQITTNLPLDLLMALNFDAKVAVLRESDGYPVSAAVGAGWMHHFNSDVFTEELEKNLDDSTVDADATIYKLFFVASKELDPRLRVHGGFQMLRGRFETRIVGGPDSEDFADGELTTTFLADNTTLAAGVDLRLSGALIFVAEAARDLTNGRARGGLGLETGIGPFRFGLGATWPGIDLGEEDLLVLDDEDLELPSIPFIPHMTLYFRF
ncbi:MAG: hypothetical protein CME06_10875 [Gemmatimonadetes bacterium]|nr:hypothetical protein [Gemmatimonadota bacterium]